MFIACYDLSEKATGYCAGELGSKPMLQHLALRTVGEDNTEAIWQLSRFVRNRNEERRPDIVVVENYQKGAGDGFSNAKALDGQSRLHAAVFAVCACYGIRPVSPYPITVRKHFCGVVSAAKPRPRGAPKRTAKEKEADRKATKLMVIKRAQLLGYLTPDCFDDNLADAAALFDWASAQWVSGNRECRMFTWSTPS